MFKIAYKTDCGAVANHNEDRVFINGNIYSCGSGALEFSDKCLVAVCDGVGGESKGELASELACNILCDYMNCDFSQAVADRYITEANKRICKLQKVSAENAKMATTIASLWLNEEDYFAFNLGDSEIYRYRTPFIFKLSTKHTMIEERISLGLEVDDSHAHIITRFLGGEYSKPSVFDGYGAMAQGDVFVIFSDGVGDVLNKTDIKNILRKSRSTTEICETIYNESVKNNSKDNISIIVVRKE